MALSIPQKLSLLMALGSGSLEEVAYYVDALDADSQDKLADYLERWDEIELKTLRIKGGEEGLDIDPAREKALISHKCRLLLKIPTDGVGYGATRLVRA